MLVFFVGMYYC